MKKLLVVILLTLCGASWATAGKPGPDCGRWSRGGAQADKAWLIGYLSGLTNAYSNFVRTGSDPVARLGSPQQAFAWMDRYCAANPTASVDQGAVQLFVELDRK